MWRVHSVGTVDAAMRFMRLCQSSRSAAKRSSRAVVSRETATSASARVRSAVRSGPATGWFAFGIAAGAPEIGHQQRQRRGCHAINTAGLSDRARTMELQLVTHFVGEARQRRVIEILTQKK